MSESTDRGMTATANGPPSLHDRVRELRLDGKGASARGRSATGVWLPWVLCILLAGAWAGIGIRYYRGGAVPTSGSANVPSSFDPSAKSDPRQPAKGSITNGSPAEQPKLEPDAVVLDWKGNIIPSHQIAISPIDVSGRIIDLRIEEGQVVKRGDLLAAIDSTPFMAEMKETEAQVASAQARLNESKAAWALEIEQVRAEVGEAKAILAEMRLVFDAARQPRSGTVASLEIGQAQRKYEAADHRVQVLELKRKLIEGEARKQRIDSLERDLQAAEARLQRAKWRLNNCKIVAPVDGVILTKKAEYGSLINPVVGGVSTSLCELADLTKLEVDLEIQERDIAKIRPGMACRIRADAFPNRMYDGYFDRAMPIANRARGIIPIRVRVIPKEGEKQGEFLKPEMNVNVTFLNRDIDPKVKAVFERQERDYRESTSDAPKGK